MLARSFDDIPIAYKKQDLNREFITLEKKLASGNYGTVYKGYLQIEHQRFQVAVKVISEISEKAKSAIWREARYHQALDHPNIVKMYGFFADTLFLVTELCPNGTLLEAILNYKKISEKDRVIIFRQLAEAIHYLHSGLIAHRDIKLENILLCKYGNVKLIDFGFAKAMDSRMQRLNSEFCGTKPYTSPEILRRETYDPFAADWYSMGIVLYTLLSQRWPFAADEVSEENSFPSTSYPDHVFSPDATQLLKRLIIDDPYLRADYRICLTSPFMCRNGQGINHNAIIRTASSNLFKNIQ